MRFNAGVSHLRNRHVLPVTAIPVVAPDAFPRWTCTRRRLSAIARPSEASVDTVVARPHELAYDRRGSIGLSNRANRAAASNFSAAARIPLTFPPMACHPLRVLNTSAATNIMVGP